MWVGSMCFGSNWDHSMLYDSMWFASIWLGVVQCVSIWFDVISCDPIWFVLRWLNMIRSWFDLFDSMFSGSPWFQFNGCVWLGNDLIRSVLMCFDWIHVYLMLVWCDPMWSDSIWGGLFWFDVTRPELIQFCLFGSKFLQCWSIWFESSLCGSIRFDLPWLGSVSFGWLSVKTCNVCLFS